MNEDAVLELLERTKPPLRAVPAKEAVANTNGASAHTKFVSASKKEAVAERNAEGSLRSPQSLPFSRLADALRDVPAEPPWVVEGYVARGATTAVAAPPKTGKTTLGFALLRAVSSGAPVFLDRAVSQAGVLLLSEERAGSMKEKDVRWNLSEGDVHVLFRSEAGDRSWPQVIEGAVAYCQEESLGVLAIDTFAAWAGLAGDAENSAGEILDRMRPLEAAAAAGLAVVLICHTRKSGGKFGEGIRGSNALAGAVDVIVELTRPAEQMAKEGIRVLYGTSRFAKTPAELAVALTDDGFEARGVASEVRAALEVERITEYLNEVESAKTDEVAEALDIPSGTVRRRLKALFDNETIGRTGSGKKGDPHVWHSNFLSATPLALLTETNL